MIKNYIPESQITRIPTEQGESIEEMVRRCVATNEPIDAIAPMVYTLESNGVMPEFNIRTDKNDLALDAVDKYQKSEIARQKLNSAKKEEEVSAQTSESNNA